MDFIQRSLDVRINRCFITVCSLCIFAGKSLYAHSLSDFLSNNLLQELISKSAITRIVYDKSELVLCPAYSELENRTQELIQGINQNIVVESLRLYSKPPAARLDNWNDAESIGIYNSIMAIQSLTGLQYYSKSRGRMNTLYETSHRIDSPATKRPMPDLVFSIPQSQIDMYAKLNDTSFGDIVLQLRFYSDNASFIVTMQNIESVSYGPFTIVAKNNFRSCVAVIDSGPYLLVYMVSFIRAVMFPGMKNRMTESINNRLDAMLNWFTQRANLAYENIGKIE